MANKEDSIAVYFDNMNYDFYHEDIIQSYNEVKTVLQHLKNSDVYNTINGLGDILVRLATTKSMIENMPISNEARFKDILKQALEPNYLKFGVEMSDEQFQQHYKRYSRLYSEVLCCCGLLKDYKQYIIFDGTDIKLANSWEKLLKARFTRYSNKVKEHKVLSDTAAALNKLLNTFSVRPSEITDLFLIEGGEFIPNPKYL